MPLSPASSSDDFFDAFFDLSLTGGILFAPVLDAAGAVVDLAYVRLNPAAQRMLALPAQPAETFLTRYPHALPTGVFAFYREAYESGEARRGDFNYQHDGLDNYFHLAARRVGQQLLVSFTDTSEQPRTAVEQALRASQARERQARAEADAERQRLHQVLRQMPANIALLRGPAHTYELVSLEYERLFPGRVLLGRTIREAIPEIAGQGFYELLDQVYHTGVPFYEPEAEAWADFAGTGELQRRYYHTSFEPIRNAQGEVTEILNFAVDVTAQVEARRQVEQLNQELEARVLARTRELAEQQLLLRRILGQVPAAVATLSGPEHRFSFFNDGYQAIVAGRAELGKTLLEAVPEVVEQGFVALLDQVYATGEPLVRQAVPAQLREAATGELVQHYVDLSYQALTDEHGQTMGILAFVVDVTDGILARRQADTLQAALLGVAQRQVQQREELFQVFEQAPAAVVLLRGPSHRIEYVNPAYQQFFPGVALRGRLLAEAHPEATASEVVARLNQVYETGEPYVGEEEPVPLYLVPGQPAQTRYFNFVYQPYREAGRIVGVSIFAYDITEPMLARRAAVRQLEVQQQELQRVLEQAPVAITILRGPELVIELANAAMSQLWGRPASHTVGRPHFEVMPEPEGQGFQNLLLQALRTGQPFTMTEALAQLGRGEQAYVNFTFQPLADEHGATTGLIAVGVEVTEQVRARQRVEQLNQELEARVLARTQEVQAAQAATERERTLLQAMLAQAPVAIALFQGDELRVASANERMAAMWGYSPAQVVGRPLMEGVPELRGQGFDDLLRQVLTTQVPVTGTETPAVMLRDGELKTTYYNFVYQPLYDAEGQVLGVINVATEVTEQVLARQQIEQLNRETEAARADAERQRGELERVFEQAPVAIAVYRGASYTIELANATVARLWGRTREQLIGKGLFEALPEVAGMGYEELLDGVMATGQPYVAHAMEAQHTREGRLDTVYWDFVYVPMHEADGSIYGVLVVATEVTAQVLARRQMEQLNQELETRVQQRTSQLSEQQELLRQILGQVPASIATLHGPEHRFSFFNELYQSLSANRTELGQTVAQVFPEVAAQGFIDLLDQVYATGEPFIGTNMPAQLYDAAVGRTRQYYVDFIYQPLFDGQRRVHSILAFILDVTDKAQARQQAQQGQLQVQELNQELAAINEELRSTNEELHDSNRRLTRTNTDLDTFVYTASHDLKAPINNIEGLLNALREYLPEEQSPDAMVPRILRMMDGAVARFLQTIGHLTEVSRIQHATQEPAEAIVLADLVNDLRLDLTPLMEATQAQLLLDFEASLTVYFSPKNLRSILYNLLSNAFKYRDPARALVVRLRAYQTKGQVVLQVEDNGLGLDENQQTRLFSLFQRLHTHVEGTGVGLYMLKKIIENAGGTIEVHSQPGVGSTFTVTLSRF